MNINSEITRLTGKSIIYSEQLLEKEVTASMVAELEQFLFVPIHQRKTVLKDGYYTFTEEEEDVFYHVYAQGLYEEFDKILGYLTRTDNYFTKFSLGNENIFTICEKVREYIEKCIKEKAIKNVYIRGIYMYGSRSMGVERKNSDIDIVVDYSGSGINEYEMIELLNNTEKPFRIRQRFVDILPICCDGNGSVGNFLLDSEDYWKEKTCSKKIPISKSLVYNHTIVNYRRYGLDCIKSKWDMLCLDNILEAHAETLDSLHSHTAGCFNKMICTDNAAAEYYLTHNTFFACKDDCIKDIKRELKKQSISGTSISYEDMIVETTDGFVRVDLKS